MHPPYEWRHTHKKGPNRPWALVHEYVPDGFLGFTETGPFFKVDDQQVAVFAALLALATDGIKTLNNINLLPVNVGIIVKYDSAGNSVMNCFDPRRCQSWVDFFGVVFLSPISARMLPPIHQRADKMVR